MLGMGCGHACIAPKSYTNLGRGGLDTGQDAEIDPSNAFVSSLSQERFNLPIDFGFKKGLKGWWKDMRDLSVNCVGSSCMLTYLDLCIEEEIIIIVAFSGITMACTICLEELELQFLHCCPQSSCEFKLCTSCVRLAFQDASGESYRRCQLCKTAMARDILESVVGKGAVNAVEDELRRKVEFVVETKAQERESNKKAMMDYKEKAASLFNILSEQLNMKCPRCQQVFIDYSGCNALTCSNDECKAAFCAVCLKDCGKNAHPHVREQHGNLFDRAAFEVAKQQREVEKIKSYMLEIQSEPFEVCQMVKNMLKGSYSMTGNIAIDKKHRERQFIIEAKDQLLSAIRSDRLGVLKDPSDTSFLREGLSHDHVSPRCVIPKEYKLEILPIGDQAFTVRLSHANGVDLLGRPNWQRENLCIFDETRDPTVTNDRRRVDALVNVKQSLKCGVLAFRGSRYLYQSSYGGSKKSLADDQVSIRLRRVTKEGNVDDETIDPRGFEIIGINQNQRFLLLEKHIVDSNDSDLLFDSLRDYIGAGSPKNLFDGIEVPAPATFDELNEQQKQVAHPLALMTATEVAGPPGTGKTKTITELIRCILECTSSNALVLSERNGAIDAIADKFVSRCLKIRGDGIHDIKDVSMWENLVVYGSRGALGPAAKLFTIEEKLKYHPELVELRREKRKKREEMSVTGKKMRTLIADVYRSFSGRFPEEVLYSRVRSIVSGTEAGFQSPLEIIHLLRSFLESTKDYLEKQGKLADLIALENVFLKGLVNENDQGRVHRENKEVVRSLQNEFARLLQSDVFDLSKAEEMVRLLRDMEANIIAAEERVAVTMEQKARIKMSTIGSSHKLPTNCNEFLEDEVFDVDDLAEAFQDTSISDNKTVLIFDEAGCIPAYELIGLTRLGQNFDAIVAVGDSKQLPPYNPSQNAFKKTFVRQYSAFSEQTKRDPIKSILDVSGRARKIKLTVQYRVPRDIAAVLNARVYKGDYTTPESCRAPHKGFVLVDVSTDRREKYVNNNEINQCMYLVRQLRIQSNSASIMFLTPYKKQQREMQFQLKRQGIDDVSILTVDQCQGQEADFVLLSLVQKPTKFLDKHRFNVALSRVRQRLYLLTNRREFEEASRDRNWECYLMAQDLLGLFENPF
ncbi:AAA domain containing protein [Nitzschia inconspicua]|uniref:AAA domain containing protein n=1 Tax=Nitzschia inconspicua TaxID=303405 RepID=A0A9K3PCI5_9STRA|nr:AAA domain containing protein [Nitzschia inconspicua]